MTSTVFQEGQSSFSGLAIRGRLHDERLLDNVEFLPTVEYWRNSSSVSAFGLSAIRRDATLGADARWMFPGEAWRFYGGAGLAVHFISNEVNAPSLGHKNDSRSEEHTSELQSLTNIVCRLLLEKKKAKSSYCTLDIRTIALHA